jgi:glutamate mutase epsilon subunit
MQVMAVEKAVKIRTIIAKEVIALATTTITITKAATTITTTTTAAAATTTAAAATTTLKRPQSRLQITQSFKICLSNTDLTKALALPLLNCVRTRVIELIKVKATLHHHRTIT